jgi:N-acetylmuramoyl-L-alanine amidase
MQKIFIDPGHGGEDNGAAYGGRLDYVEEADLNLINVPAARRTQGPRDNMWP